ncbi:MAG: hypothetical protein M3N16_00285 [Actinomycetota bacterium]|nr:hypothetical protein [Actinomycetota bacterium]
MAGTRYPYACNAASKQLVALFGALGEQGILGFTPERALLERSIQRCSTCARDRPAKFCTGWITTIDPSVATFAPVRVKGGRMVQPELAATIDYSRAQPGVAEDWEAAPMQACVLALEILDTSGELLERHHIDLANALQDGPAWHLQYGGNSRNFPKPKTQWLGPPRWAVPPADLALMLETVAFNFYYHKWQELNGDGNWLRAVKRAEDLSMRHYVERLAQHFRRESDDRQQTWLAMQDNATWDPRPT